MTLCATARERLLYITDVDTGEIWTTTALPSQRAREPYKIRHGFGYSVFDA